MQDELIRVQACIGGQWRAAEAVEQVRDPYRGTVVGEVPVSTPRDCSDALDAARGARGVMAAMPGYERAAMLRRMADRVQAQAARIARVMARESGKAIRDCIIEVERSADTLRLCAEEAIRIQGEHVPMDGSAMGAGKLAFTMRFPMGVVAAITPFNGPVNLAAHKLGPALAAGNTIVIKPSPKAPLCLHLFIEAVIEAGAPDGAVNTLYGDAVGPMMVSDDRVDMISFTGSIPVGKRIRQSAGMKPVALELGGVGPSFVHHDADVPAAATACARNGLLLAGQSCISVQNVYVHEAVAEAFQEQLAKAAAAIRFGDPLDPETDVGTLIDEAAAVRVEGMVTRALDRGAVPLCLGRREGATLTGTVLTGVTPEMDIVSDEIFGPALSVMTYTDPAPIFARISDSPYGLQAGIFTQSLPLAMQAFRNLRTGGVILNGTSRWRSDQMPYGGVKDSGMGREGPKFAIRDMTEERLLVIN